MKKRNKLDPAVKLSECLQVKVTPSEKRAIQRKAETPPYRSVSEYGRAVMLKDLKIDSRRILSRIEGPNA